MNVETRPIAQVKKTIGSVFPFDIFLLLIVVALVIVGIVMVYSSSWNFAVWAGRDTSYLLTRQVMWLVVGTGAAVFASLFDYHRYKPFLLIMLVGTIGMLAAVLVFGEERFSATRTFIAGAGQPSEFAKLVVIIYLAFWLFNRREKINNIFFGLIPLAGILGLVSSFIALQPDLSAVITIMAIGAIMFFLIGADFRQILSVIILMAIAGSFIIFFSEKGRNRVNEYMAGLQDPVNTSYHIQHSMKAIAEGELFGVGIGNGTVKYSLPVSWTDSIFAVIVEETGLVGAAVVILLYLLLLWRGLYIASRAPDELGKLMAAGITLWIILEALINMGVLVNLIPSAGNALPLISAGGSNLVSVLIGLGILMNISRMTAKQKQEEESSRRYAGAVVDMRWRDGGGGVYPALAVLQTLEADNHAVLWVGSQGSMEASLVQRAGIPYRDIPAAGIHGVGLKHLPRNTYRILQGVSAARNIINEFKPEVLFFTGGYVSVPVAIAGRKLPILLYVPDIEPGYAINLVSRFADVIATTVDSTQQKLSGKAKKITTGYPIRSSLSRMNKIEALKFFNLKNDHPTLFVFGGSLGARAINNALIPHLPELLVRCNIIHLTGTNNWQDVQQQLAGMAIDSSANYRVYPYLNEEMAAAFSAADLVVSRAGASSLGELPYFGLPAVLVPYPHAWKYQKLNADYLVSRQAAVILENQYLDDQLVPVVLSLLDQPERLLAMRKAMEHLATPSAAQDIMQLLLSMAQSGTRKGAAA